MINNQDKSHNSDYFLFFVWPFVIFLKSLIHLRGRTTGNIIWLYICFTALALVFSVENSDVYRYAKEFTYLSERNLSFGSFFGNIYSDPNSLDIFRPIMFFIVSRFTSDPRIYFLFIAAIYGYFFSRNFTFVIKNVESNFTRFQILVLFTFFFIIPLQDYQFVRFSTAAHIFFFGAFPFLLEKKRKYLLFAMGSALVHFSFFIPVLVLIIFTITPKNIHIFFILYLISIFVLNVELGTLNLILDKYSPDILHEKAHGYGSESMYENQKEAFEATRWYIQYYKRSIDYLSIAFFICVYAFWNKALRVNPRLMKTFCFALFFTSIANIINAFPSGFRFITVSMLFTYAFIVLVIPYINDKKGFIVLRNLSIPVLLFFIIVSLRFSVDVLSLSAFISNPIVAIFIEDTQALIDYIK